MKAHFILYVSDQRSSAKFYKSVLGIRPTLDVPGMTEFLLNDGAVLGLMPVAGIKRQLGEKLPNPDNAQGIPRSEVYLFVDDPEMFHSRSLKFGGQELSGLSLRDWGHEAAYSMDADGHVLVFAKERSANKSLHQIRVKGTGR